MTCECGHEQYQHAPQDVCVATYIDPQRRYIVCCECVEFSQIPPAHRKEKEMAHTTLVVVGTNANIKPPWEGDVRRDGPMSIPSGCQCTWIVRANQIWVLKYQSNMCPFKNRH